MQKLMVLLVVSLLWLCPFVVGAQVSTGEGEQSVEQGKLLSKDHIQQVQERLKAEGFDPGPVDGALHAQTEAAIRQYQQKQGLPVSGALDEATLRELQLSLTPRGGDSQ